MKPLRIAACSLALAWAAFGVAAADETAGRVLKAQPEAFQARSVVGHAIIEGDPIYRQARVYTKESGSVIIKFKDGTNLTVAPNASLMIDDYLFAGEAAPGALALSLTRGALRMISGRMPKRDVALKTPIGTIGVRGTDFWIEVVNSEQIWIWMQEGAVVASPNEAGSSYEYAAPTHLTCTPTFCEAREAPPLPTAFPLSSAGGEGERGGPGVRGRNGQD